MTTTNELVPVPGKAFLVVIVAIVALLAGGYYYLSLDTVETPAVYTIVANGTQIRVQQNRHAERYHSDADVIRRCNSQNGPNIVYKNSDDRYFLVCQLPDGRFGYQIVQKIRDVWEEITAYSPGDGSWSTVSNYLHKTGATRYTGGMP